LLPEYEISEHPYALRQERYQYHSHLRIRYHLHQFAPVLFYVENRKCPAVKEELESVVEEVEVLIELMAALSDSTLAMAEVNG
jgi:hypothetical protein